MTSLPGLAGRRLRCAIAGNPGGRLRTSSSITLFPPRSAAALPSTTFVLLEDAAAPPLIVLALVSIPPRVPHSGPVHLRRAPPTAWPARPVGPAALLHVSDPPSTGKPGTTRVYWHASSATSSPPALRLLGLADTQPLSPRPRASGERLTGIGRGFRYM